MADSIELLTGISGAGKTEHLLRLYADALQAAQDRQELGATLWLAPSQLARMTVEQRLLERCRGVLFRPNVLTFGQFAERLLRAEAPPVTGITAIAQRMLVRRVVERLLAAGQIVHFAPIASTAGFIDLVIGLIAELKRSDVWPQAFQEACRRHRSAARDRELCLIYQAYQEVLVARRLYDADGQFWSAREAARRGQWGTFSQLSLVVVDDFVDFTAAQYEILGHLARHAGRVIVSLPFEAGQQRQELFGVTRRTAEALSRHAKVAEEAISTAASSEAPPGVAQIARQLFGNQRAMEAAADASGLELMAVGGPPGEVQYVACRVKSLLLNGVPADEIAVYVRPIDEYAELFRNAFASAGISHAVEGGTPLARVGLVRVLLALVRLELEDWPFESLRNVLDSSSFQPDWPEWQDGAAARDVARVLRGMLVPRGRQVMLAALEGAKAADASAARASKFLERFSAALAPLRRQQTLASWNDALREVAASCGFLAEGASPRDQLALSGLTGAMAAAAWAHHLFEEPAPQIDLQAFLALANDAARVAAITDPPPKAGHVRILSAAAGRHLRVPYLFIAGLNEQSFPARQRDDCLLQEADRKALNEQGVPMKHASRLAEEEMLFFYRLLTRATRRLVLTWPAVNAKGEPQSPSSYVADVLALFDGKCLQNNSEEQLEPIPQVDCLLSPADVRIRAMHDALDRKPELLAGALCEPRLSAALDGALCAAEMNHARFHQAGFGPFEGLLGVAPHQARLAALYDPDTVFSPTQLEEYAYCPFRYFVQRVLQVEELPRFEVATDRQARGELVHSILAQLYRGLLEETAGDAFKFSRAELERRFLELALQRLSSRPHAGPQVGIARADERLLRELAVEFGRQHESYLQTVGKLLKASPRPALLEAAFGPNRTRAGQPSPSSCGPLVLGTGSRAVKIHGRIDRVDLVEAGPVPSCLVIDYKTGSPYRFNSEEVSTGRALQLVMYGLAVERLKLAGGPVRVAQLGYWHVTGAGFVPGLKSRKRGPLSQIEPQTWQELCRAAEEVAPNLVAGMRQGCFPVVSADPECTGRCPLRTVCRVSQIRALPRALEKHWSPGARLHAEAFAGAEAASSASAKEPE